ncbi:HD domain protein [Vibrio phage 2.275.O._10N.286.54.E11]|nr:HD domain protein [Vibrio phage 2.275.O._10N.286.54.E11]
MNQATQLAIAISLASEGHKDQFDKGGNPYILHPLKVMHKLKTDDFELMQIAVMHDLIEDTDMTYARLRELGFSERVIEGLKPLTKVPGITNEEYEVGICKNYDSIRVKMEDVRHNMDARRLKGLSDKDFSRMQKYQKLYVRLKKARTKFEGL